jgi:GMP synthase (glutamine-hydrolysing)
MTARRVIVVQHVEEEGPGLLAPVLAEAGLLVEMIGPRDPIPRDALVEAAGLIVLGGPMGVYDAVLHPRLDDEVALLRAAVARETPTLGICLGSQLLAAALGARVYPGARKELGWYDVTLEADADDDWLFRGVRSPFKALHWHGDLFDLPAGARPLAHSAMTACQAYSAGRAWGLLFHLEAGSREVERMASAFAEEVAAAGTSREELLAGAATYAAATSAIGRSVFARWAALVGG